MSNTRGSFKTSMKHGLHHFVGYLKKLGADLDVGLFTGFFRTPDILRQFLQEKVDLSKLFGADGQPQENLPTFWSGSGIAPIIAEAAIPVFGILALINHYLEVERQREQVSAYFFLLQLSFLVDEAIRLEEENFKILEEYGVKAQQDGEKEAEQEQQTLSREDLEKKYYLRFIKIVLGEDEKKKYAQENAAKVKEFFRTIQEVLYYNDPTIATIRLKWRRLRARLFGSKFSGRSYQEFIIDDYAQVDSWGAKENQESLNSNTDENKIILSRVLNYLKDKKVDRDNTQDLVADELADASKAPASKKEPSNKWTFRDYMAFIFVPREKKDAPDDLGFFGASWEIIKRGFPAFLNYAFTYAFWFWIVWAGWFFIKGINSFSIPNLLEGLSNFSNATAHLASGVAVGGTVLGMVSALTSFLLPLIPLALIMLADFCKKTPQESLAQEADRNKRIAETAELYIALLKTRVKQSKSRWKRWQAQVVQGQQDEVESDDQQEIFSAVPAKPTREQRLNLVELPKEKELADSFNHSTWSEVGRRLARLEPINAAYALYSLLTGTTLPDQRKVKTEMELVKERLENYYLRRTFREILSSFFSGFVQGAFIWIPVITFLGMVGVAAPPIPIIIMVMIGVGVGVGIFKSTSTSVSDNIQHQKNLDLLMLHAAILQEVIQIEQEIAWMEQILKRNYQDNKQVPGWSPPIIGVANFATGKRIFDEIKLQSSWSYGMHWLKNKSLAVIDSFGSGMLVLRLLLLLAIAIAAVSASAAAALAVFAPPMVLGAVALVITAVFCIFKLWQSLKQEQKKNDEAVIAESPTRLAALKKYKTCLQLQLAEQNQLNANKQQAQAESTMPVMPSSSPKPEQKRSFVRSITSWPSRFWGKGNGETQTNKDPANAPKIKT